MTSSEQPEQDNEHISTSLIHISVQKSTQTYTLHEAIKRSGVPRHVWLRYWLWGLADSEGAFNNLQRRFDDDAIARIRRAEYIRHETGGSLQSSAVIVKLLDKIEKLEKELDFYH